MLHVNTTGPRRASKTGIALGKALKADAELVLDAMRMIAEGASKRRDFLIERGGDTTITTLLRHAEEYAEIWRSERPKAHPSGLEPRQASGLEYRIRALLQAEGPAEAQRRVEVSTLLSQPEKVAAMGILARMAVR